MALGPHISNQPSSILGKDSQWKNSSRSLISLHNVLDTAPTTNFASNSWKQKSHRLSSNKCTKTNHPPSTISTKHLLCNMTICDDDLKQSNKLLGQYIITLTRRLLLNHIHRIKPNLLLKCRFWLQSRILE